MNIVVDTSVILAVLLEEPEKKDLLAITKDCELLAPGSLYWELGNALSAMFKKNRITLKESLQVIEVFEQIRIKYCKINISKALELAFEMKMYAYDAYMIECARNQKAPLLTLDTVLRENALLKKVKIIEVK
jgi:predicted nucleic acid-binding protein